MQKKCRDDEHIVSTFYTMVINLFHLYPNTLRMCGEFRCVHTLY